MTEKIFSTIKKAILLWVGLCLVIFGVASLAIPIIPGFVLIFLGAGMLTNATKNLAKCPVISSLHKFNTYITLNRKNITRQITARLK